jgi:hypothetical protein
MLLKAAAVDLPLLKTMCVHPGVPIIPPPRLSSRAPQERSFHECSDAGQDTSEWQRLHGQNRRARGGASICRCRQHVVSLHR